MTGRKPGAVLLVAASLIAGRARAQLPAALERADRATVGPVEMEMRWVCFRVSEQVGLGIRYLRGVLEPTDSGAAPWFEDPTSFRIVIDTADIGITPASLSALLNQHVFAYEGSPLGELTVRIAGGGLRMSGKLTRGIDVPFGVDAQLSLTREGLIRLHPTSIRALGLTVGGLLDFFGIELEHLVKLRERRGVQIVENDFLLDPAGLLPPPLIEGRLTSVEIRDGQIRQVFGRSERAAPLPEFQRTDSITPHYMIFQGRQLRFGKLTMHQADLQIIDADPKDPFDFHLRHLNRQLVAGATLNQPDFGLLTVMPDYDDLRGSARGTGPRTASSRLCALSGRPGPP